MLISIAQWLAESSRRSHHSHRIETLAPGGLKPVPPRLDGNALHHYASGAIWSQPTEVLKKWIGSHHCFSILRSVTNAHTRGTLSFVGFCANRVENRFGCLENRRFPRRHSSLRVRREKERTSFRRLWDVNPTPCSEVSEANCPDSALLERSVNAWVGWESMVAAPRENSSALIFYGRLVRNYDGLILLRRDL